MQGPFPATFALSRCSLTRMRSPAEHQLMVLPDAPIALGLPGPSPEIDIGSEAGSKEHTKQTILFHAELNNEQPPSLPTNLVWYPYEATWQQIAEGRLTFGLKNFLLYLNYNDDFGINAGLKLKIEKAGLDLGGTFERQIATSWRISGDFATKSSKGKNG